MSKNNQLRNYKKHCQPDNQLVLKLALKARSQTLDKFTEHPKEFPVIFWLVSFN